MSPCHRTQSQCSIAHDHTKRKNIYVVSACPPVPATPCLEEPTAAAPADTDNDDDMRSMRSVLSRRHADPAVDACPFVIFNAESSDVATLLDVSFTRSLVTRSCQLPPNPKQDWQIRSNHDGYFVHSASLQASHWAPRLQ